jgi:hypothetical protein
VNVHCKVNLNFGVVGELTLLRSNGEYHCRDDYKTRTVFLKALWFKSQLRFMKVFARSQDERGLIFKSSQIGANSGMVLSFPGLGFPANAGLGLAMSRILRNFFIAVRAASSFSSVGSRQNTRR